MNLGIILGLIAAISWGVSAILIKLSVKDKGAVTANLIRLYIVAFLYSVIFFINNNFNEIFALSKTQLFVAFISAQLGFVIGDYFYFNALKIAGVSRTVPATSSYPLWAILWAFLFLGRGINLKVVFGALLIFSAIVLVRKTEEEEHISLRGIIYAILAPISWSLAITTLDWLSSQISPFTLAGLRMILASIGVSLLLPSILDEIKRVTKFEFIAIGLAGIFGLLIGQYAFVKAINLAGSQIVTPVTAVNPVISSTLAILVLKEPPNRKIIMSLALAVIGILIISSA
jgi:DME family drug/metabolite transporter